MKSNWKHYLVLIAGIPFLSWIIYMMNVENGIELKHGLIYVFMVGIPMIAVIYKLVKK